MLHLNQNMLRAAATLAAKKDPRHYLESVRIEPRDHGAVYYVATNGHVLGVFESAPEPGDALVAPVTLPTAAVNNALKLAGKNGTIELHDDLTLSTPGGEVRADALKDTRYPDWSMVWPATVDYESPMPAGNGYVYNPELLQRAATALGLAQGMPPGRAKQCPVHLANNARAGGAGLMRTGNLPAGVVIMPMRDKARPDWTPTPATSE